MFYDGQNRKVNLNQEAVVLQHGNSNYGRIGKVVDANVDKFNVTVQFDNGSLDTVMIDEISYTWNPELARR